MADNSPETADQPQTPQLHPYLLQEADALADSISAAFKGDKQPNSHVARELDGIAAALTTMGGASEVGAHELREGDKKTREGVLKAFGMLADLSRHPYTTHLSTIQYSGSNRGQAVSSEIRGTLATHRALQYTHETQFAGSEEEPPLDEKFLEIADALIDRTNDNPGFLDGMLFIGMHGWARMDRRERTEFVASILDESPVEHVLNPVKQAMSMMDRVKQNPVLGRFWKIGKLSVPATVKMTGEHGSKILGAFTERGLITQDYMEARAREQAETYLQDPELADGRYPVEHVLEGVQLTWPGVIPRDKINTAYDYTALVKAIALRLPLRMPDMFVDPKVSSRAKQVAFFAMRCAATDLVERPDYSVLQQADAKVAADAQAQNTGKK